MCCRMIASMNHKLSFQRNPRFPPSRPPGGHQGSVEHKYKWGIGKIPDVPRPMKSTLTRDPMISIMAEPPVITFSDYREDPRRLPVSKHPRPRTIHVFLHGT